MVAYEKGSKDVLGLGPPDPAFIARGEQNFSRFAAVLNDSLKGKTWVLGNRLTLADFSIGGFPPQSVGAAGGTLPGSLPLVRGLDLMPAWRDALAARDAALALWLSKRAAMLGPLRSPRY
jgi:glutathione S-transferase